MLTELARAFVDVDGNFLRDFQTTGFNARLWELYLSAFLYEQRFETTRKFKRPDFCVQKGGSPIGIEAVTVNPTAGDPPLKPRDDKEARALTDDYMPIKFGSVLFSKLQKRYWDLQHMQGKPFILAVHDFCADDSMTWSAPAMNDYLFGLRASWKHDSQGCLKITEHRIKEHRWNNELYPIRLLPPARHRARQRRAVQQRSYAFKIQPDGEASQLWKPTGEDGSVSEPRWTLTPTRLSPLSSLQRSSQESTQKPGRRVSASSTTLAHPSRFHTRSFPDAPIIFFGRGGVWPWSLRGSCTPLIP